MNNTNALWRICQRSVRPRSRSLRVLATIETTEAEVSLLARDYAMEIGSDVFVVRIDYDAQTFQATYYEDGTRRRHKETYNEGYDFDRGEWAKVQ